METEMEAKLINRFSIEAAGNGKGLLGDINGDGRMEVVFVRADGDIDDRYVPHQVTCVTAFDLEGNMLWQTGGISGKPGNFGSDFHSLTINSQGVRPFRDFNRFAKLYASIKV